MFTFQNYHLIINGKHLPCGPCFKTEIYVDHIIIFTFKYINYTLYLNYITIYNIFTI